MLEWWVSSGFGFYYILSHMTWRPLQKKLLLSSGGVLNVSSSALKMCRSCASEQSCSSFLFSTIPDFVLIICI